MKVKGSLYWIYSFTSGCKGKMLVAILLAVIGVLCGMAPYFALAGIAASQHSAERAAGQFAHCAATLGPGYLENESGDGEVVVVRQHLWHVKGQQNRISARFFGLSPRRKNFRGCRWRAGTAVASGACRTTWRR